MFYVTFGAPTLTLCFVPIEIPLSLAGRNSDCLKSAKATAQLKVQHLCLLLNPGSMLKSGFWHWRFSANQIALIFYQSRPTEQFTRYGDSVPLKIFLQNLRGHLQPNSLCISSFLLFRQMLLVHQFLKTCTTKFIFCETDPQSRLKVLYQQTYCCDWKELFGI